MCSKYFRNKLQNHYAIDKEAVRQIKKLKFSNPPTLNEQAQHFCFTVPVAFKLEELN